MATMATTGTGVQSSREARRRRILERGSDRLALVTGRIQSLPSEPDPDQSRPATSSTDQSSPPHESIQHEDIASASSLPEKELSQRDVSDVAVRKPSLQRNIGGRMASRAAALLGVEKELSKVSSFVQDGIRHLPSVQGGILGSSADQGGIQDSSAVQGGILDSSSVQSAILDHQREKHSQHRSFIMRQICFSITASENDRILCSIAAAILVVLLHVGFPIPGLHFLKGVILFKPVYLLILTNASIVVRRLILSKPGAEAKPGQVSTASLFGGDGLAQLGKALEVGLLLQKISVALFMDFSVYAVVLVCGLSVIKRFGG